MAGTSANAAADSAALTTSFSGYHLLRDPMLNKGTAFSDAERDEFDLHGLLPPHVGSLDEQASRRLQVLRGYETDLERYAFVRDLQDNNETLFYALLVDHLEELLPIVYTPTVGAGCQKFSQVFRKPRGLYLSPPHKDRLVEILSHPRFDQVEAIVVTDGERILGLGDQGAGGMGIPIGKLSLYTGCGGIHPASTLPIMLDVGTDNAERLADPLYIGWRHARLRGQGYDDFVDAFVAAVAARWPHVLLQFEDFAGSNAGRLLARYRDQLCMFNDDIQGTAAVAAATVMAATNATGIKLTEQRIAVVGAGSAGLGISNLILQAMIDGGLSEAEARSRFYLVDRPGLLVEGMSDLQPPQLPFLQKRAAVAGWTLDRPGAIGLKDVAANAKLTALIGVSGQAGAFTEAAIRAMAANTARPTIFPLSNPTSRSEATPSDLLAWTDGRAIIGTGSPFAPVQRDGKSIKIDQTNNAYIFPGIGLGVIAAKARRVSDTMFMAAALALAEASPTRQDKTASLLPPVAALREVSFKVALAVALRAQEEGLAAKTERGALEAAIRAKMWQPAYRPYRRAAEAK
jgi:malate dehydrogenase (oxaloacetate-decarboxylating)